MILDEIAEYLHAQGVANYGVDLFTVAAPDTPDRLTLLTSYPGEEPVRVKDRQLVVHEKPRIQVSNRSRNAIQAERDAFFVFQYLDGFRGVLSEVTYSSIRGLHTPYGMPGRDSKNRLWFVCNYAVVKEPSPIL